MQKTSNDNYIFNSNKGNTLLLYKKLGYWNWNLFPKNSAYTNSKFDDEIPQGFSTKEDAVSDIEKTLQQVYNKSFRIILED